MTDMTEPNRTGTPGVESEAPDTPATTRRTTRRGGGDPATRGRTTIADGVVEKIAGLAARDVLGVHALGSGLSRTFGPTVRVNCASAPDHVDLLYALPAQSEAFPDLGMRKTRVPEMTQRDYLSRARIETAHELVEHSAALLFFVALH